MDHTSSRDRSPDDPSGDPPSVRRLERQVERGHLFMHTALGESFSRLGESVAFLHGVVDVLLAKGVVTEDEVRDATGYVRQELTERGELDGPGIAIRDEPPSGETPATTLVDCQSRLHVCHAVCCKLSFARSASEIESGKVRWDLGRPYSGDAS